MQGSVVQAIVWLTILLFVLELRRTRLDLVAGEASSSFGPGDHGKALQMVEEGRKNLEGEAMEVEGRETSNNHRASFKPLMKKVWLKLAANPNSYACIIGFAWAFVAKRYFSYFKIFKKKKKEFHFYPIFQSLNFQTFHRVFDF